MKIGKNVKIWHKEKSVFGNCKIGDGCTIHAPVWIGDDVIIGKDCKIQAFAFIPPAVRIGNDVFIGPGVIFTNDKHPPSGSWIETNVENNVRIGARAVILPGCHLRTNAIIGAGAVVTHEVLKNTIVVGNRARILEVGKE